jgi:putative amino-acid transport system substrate-binding protein
MFKKKMGVALAIALMAALGLTGCSGSEAAEKPVEVNESTVIRVGTGGAYKPWCYKENDELKGFEIDTWNEIGSRTGYEVEFTLGKFSTLVGLLDVDKVDTVAHQLSIRPDREEKYDFTEPYAYSKYDFIIKDDSEYARIEDLKGKKVGAWLGGNGEKTLRALNEEFELDLDMSFYDGTPLEKEVEIGRLDACWQSAVKSMATIEDGNLDVRLMDAQTEIGREINAYPFLKDSGKEDMLREVAAVIDEMHEDGTLTELSNKWFKLDTTKK